MEILVVSLFIFNDILPHVHLLEDSPGEPPVSLLSVWTMVHQQQQVVSPLPVRNNVTHWLYQQIKRSSPFGSMWRRWEHFLFDTAEKLFINPKKIGNPGNPESRNINTHYPVCVNSHQKCIVAEEEVTRKKCFGYLEICVHIKRFVRPSASKKQK